MGDVIEFRAVAAGGRSRRSASEAAVDCRILLFTGVRYERHAEVEVPAMEPPAATKPRVGQRRRKKQA